MFAPQTLNTFSNYTPGSIFNIKLCHSRSLHLSPSHSLALPLSVAVESAQPYYKLNDSKYLSRQRILIGMVNVNETERKIHQRDRFCQETFLFCSTEYLMEKKAPRSTIEYVESRYSVVLATSDEQNLTCTRYDWISLRTHAVSFYSMRRRKKQQTHTHTYTYSLRASETINVK